jgi:hypothetical protein
LFQTLIILALLQINFIIFPSYGVENPINFEYYCYHQSVRFLTVLYRSMISSIAVDFVAFTAFFVEAAVFLATVDFGAFTAFFVEAAVFLATVLFFFGAI